ncbi:MAG: anthranilate phosphoribosyltransferase [Rickettsiales bacterium]
MGTNHIQDILTMLAKRQNLPREEAERAFQIMLGGGATPAQISAFLMGLRQKGETVDELIGGATVLRAKMKTIKAPEGAIDCCGTGGDARRTLNISTAAAIVLAACGVKVAKHGNRAITSASGSSDILRELGINIEAAPEVAERALKECGMCFLMAPLYHASLRHVAPVRLELGLRTIFNLLGPLANPAGVKRQVVGVYAKEWIEPMAHTLHGLGTQRAWVVCGADGMDELTTTGETYVASLDNGAVETFTVMPESVGLERASLDQLKGLDAEYNAKALNELLAGKKGAYRDIVLLNSAAGLVVADAASQLKDGIAIAAEAIDSGKAQRVLAQLIQIMN